MGPEQATRIRILLVDDHPLVRQALRHVLEEEPDLEVVSEAGNGRQAVDMTQEYQPDIVIMDISMPVLNGLEATKQIKATKPYTSVLILTVHNDIETIFSILQAGASGYLLKTVFGPEVVNTVRAVHDGDMVLAPAVSQQLLRYALQHVPKVARPQSLGVLTSREIEVVKLAASGASNKEIGARLCVTEATVKSYLVDIFQKLRVRSRTEAIFVCLKSGTLTLDDIG